MVIGWVLLGPRTPRLLTPAVFMASLPIAVAFAPAAAVTLVTGFWCVARIVRYEHVAERGRRRRAGGRCPACGYMMSGLNTEVCPECGVSGEQWMARFDAGRRLG